MKAHLSFLSCLLFFFFGIAKSKSQILTGQNSGPGIIFHDYIPDSIFGYGSCPIDVNMDGTNDFIYKLVNSSSAWTVHHTWYIQTLNLNQIVVGYDTTLVQNAPLSLDSGSWIDSNLIWESNSAYGFTIKQIHIDLPNSSHPYSYSNRGPFSNNVANYLGVRILTITDTVYAYIHVQTLESTSSGVILDFGCSIPTVEITEASSSPVKIFPNPFNNQIKLESNCEKEYELKLYDPAMRIIYDLFISGNAFLETGNLPSGIYFCELKFSDGRRIVEKIVKEK